MKSNPREVDSDDDKIEDYTELKEGWTVPVIKPPVTVDGTTYTGPFRYAPNNSSATSEPFDSNPLYVDTDSDDLTDSEEKNQTKTDPRDRITYSLTRVHQADIVDASSVDRLEALGNPTAAVGRPVLTDATDDFDFVRADDGSLVFRALDRTDRTDTWLSNADEVTQRVTVDEPHDHDELDPWDPDTDNDGLTDGQEVVGITSARIVDARPGPYGQLQISGPTRRDLSPVDPDTDGDGWWDG